MRKSNQSLKPKLCAEHVFRQFRLVYNSTHNSSQTVAEFSTIYADDTLGREIIIIILYFKNKQLQPTVNSIRQPEKKSRDQQSWLPRKYETIKLARRETKKF